VRTLVALLLLLPSLALGQTYTGLYSPWTPWDARIKYTWFVALLDASGVEVNRNAAPVGSLITTAPLVVTFPAKPASAIVAKVQVGFSETGTTGGIVDLTGAWSGTYTLPQSFAIPAGAVTTLTYTSMTFSPTLTVAVVVPPPPPAPTGDSKPGDCSPPLTQLTLLGRVYTISGGTVFKDKVPLTANAYPDFVLMCINGTAIRAFNSSGIYATWNGKAWQ
jgi:hypothetical protein